MGPRHYSRGNSLPVKPKVTKPIKFQWGHDITVVET